MFEYVRNDVGPNQKIVHIGDSFKSDYIMARKSGIEAIHIPTIGIGAGAGCDGQILVYADMLSMFSDFSPKFVRSFANVGEIMSQAFKDYDAAVKDSSFPAQEHTFKIDEEVLDKLY